MPKFIRLFPCFPGQHIVRPWDKHARTPAVSSRDRRPTAKQSKAHDGTFICTGHRAVLERELRLAATPPIAMCSKRRGSYTNDRYSVVCRENAMCEERGNCFAKPTLFFRPPSHPTTVCERVAFQIHVAVLLCVGRTSSQHWAMGSAPIMLLGLLHAHPPPPCSSTDSPEP